MDNYPFTVIAVDFDGTIIKRGDFPKAEHPIPGAVEALKKFMSVGKDKFRFVLWSSRDEKDTKTNCYKQMIEFIEKNGLKFDAINDNIKEYKNDGIVSRKIIADCYIDDLGYPARDETEIIDMWKRVDAVADAFISIYGTKELEQNKEQQNG